MKLTYAMCRICGDQPKTSADRMNIGPVLFWEPDDGWVFGALCPYCYEDYGHAKPKPEDYAYDKSNGVCDDEQSDEDITDALFDAI